LDFAKLRQSNLNKLSKLLINVWDKKDAEIKNDGDDIDKIDSAYIYDAFPYDFITGEKIVNVSSFNY
jgi:hypothetical protein